MNESDSQTISLAITPKSKKNAIAGWITSADGKYSLKVKVAAQPEDGKANAELISFLAKQWKVKKSALEIISGAASKHKLLKVKEKITLPPLQLSLI